MSDSISGLRFGKDDFDVDLTVMQLHVTYTTWLPPILTLVPRLLPTIVVQ